MRLWRLIAHHEQPDQAIEAMASRDRIAVGWSLIGDLSKNPPMDSSDLTRRISACYPDLDNAHLGGPSLWNLWCMEPGDLVIVNARGRRRKVFEITGGYEYDKVGILEYSHLRHAVLTEMDPEHLWRSAGSSLMDGQNVRWTVVQCAFSDSAPREILKEGTRNAVLSTAIERNPKARQLCLAKYGSTCQVCKFDFERNYGELGRGYIHVHHREDLALRQGEHEVDPIKDLIPLCPNCHAMAHKRSPAVPIEELKSIWASLHPD